MELEQEAVSVICSRVYILDLLRYTSSLVHLVSRVNDIRSDCCACLYAMRWPCLWALMLRWCGGVNRYRYPTRPR